MLREMALELVQLRVDEPPHGHSLVMHPLLFRLGERGGGALRGCVTESGGAARTGTKGGKGTRRRPRLVRAAAKSS